MVYTLCVLVGIALSFAARTLITDEAEPPIPHGPALTLIALIGAAGGAFVFEAPADFFGWTGGIAGEPAVVHGLGGRTVLGGLLGGWIAVEAGKRGLGITQPTGDGFALPLAIGLACGRMGCFFTGCCAGRVSSGHDWWSGLALSGHDGLPRFPAQLTEVAFHVSAAIALIALTRAHSLRHRRFAVYVAVYAVVRFAIEGVRDNPPLVLGMTYYQLLAIPLFVLEATTVILRTVSSRAGAGGTAATSVVRL